MFKYFPFSLLSCAVRKYAILSHPGRLSGQELSLIRFSTNCFAFIRTHIANVKGPDVSNDRANDVFPAMRRDAANEANAATLTVSSPK
jgi:hypothetical protein